MSGILPDVPNGGTQFRAIDGTCTNPANVSNAYCPPATFTSTCALTALPNDCTARISAGQINAIVSELMCLAVAMNPTGQWNCNSLCNLSGMFAAWVAAHGLPDGVTITGAGTAASPYTIDPLGVASAFCTRQDALQALSSCLIDSGAVNLITQGVQGKLAVTPSSVAAGICGNDAAGDSIAACMRSVDAGNRIVMGSDGRLFVAAGGVVVGAPATCNAGARGTLSITAAGVLMVCDGISNKAVVDDTGFVQLNLFSATAVLPAATVGSVVGTPSSTTITNPSAARSARLTVGLLGGELVTGAQGANPTATTGVIDISLDGGASFTQVAVGYGGASAAAGARGGTFSFFSGSAPQVFIPPGGSVVVQLRPTIADTQARSTNSTANVFAAVNLHW